MTKTESAEKLIKTLVIESCEQLLDFHGAEGVRAAIPNTKNLIMVGTQEWIAKNVPGVEAMVASALTDERIFEIGLALSIKAFTDKAFRDKNGSSGTASENEAFRKEIDFAGAIEREVITRLAATTQASTAQAEPVAWMVGRELFLSHDAIPPRLLPPLGNPMPLYAATSSTDAQAAAEVRDAWISVDERLPECVHECTTSGTDVSNTVLMFGRSINGAKGQGVGHLQDDGKWVCYDGEYDEMNVVEVTHWMPLPKAPSALRAGDTGEQADGGAAEQEGA